MVGDSAASDESESDAATISSSENSGGESRVDGDGVASGRGGVDRYVYAVDRESVDEAEKSGTLSPSPPC